MIDGLPELDDMVQDFVVESSESLSVAIDDVLSLEQGHDQEAIDRIFRAMHTIKGTAAMLDLTGLSGFVHRLEDACADVRAGRRTVDKHTADALLKCLDFIQLKLDALVDTSREEEDFTCGEEYLKPLLAEPRPAAESPPLRAVDQSPPAPEGPHELPASAGTGRRCKVLLVEDDFLVRKMMYSFLSEFTKCRVAKDGNEAIQAVTESYMGPDPEPFSLILMDVMMPIIDGLRATRAIRELERAKGAGYTHARAEIVVTSAADDLKAMHETCRECGADSYVPKPMDRSQLKQLLIRHLSLRHGPDRYGGREGLCA